MTAYSGTAVLAATNALLRSLRITDRPFVSVSELTHNASSALVAIAERLFNMRLANVIRRPATDADYVHNAQVVLDHVRAILPPRIHIPMGLSGDAIVCGDMDALGFIISLLTDTHKAIMQAESDLAGAQERASAEVQPRVEEQASVAARAGSQAYAKPGSVAELRTTHAERARYDAHARSAGPVGGDVQEDDATGSVSSVATPQPMGGAAAAMRARSAALAYQASASEAQEQRREAAQASSPAAEHAVYSARGVPELPREAREGHGRPATAPHSQARSPNSVSPRARSPTVSAFQRPQTAAGPRGEQPAETGEQAVDAGAGYARVSAGSADVLMGGRHVHYDAEVIAEDEGADIYAPYAAPELEDEGEEGSDKAMSIDDAGSSEQARVEEEHENQEQELAPEQQRAMYLQQPRTQGGYGSARGAARVDAVRVRPIQGARRVEGTTAAVGQRLARAPPAAVPSSQARGVRAMHAGARPSTQPQPRASYQTSRATRVQQPRVQQPRVTEQPAQVVRPATARPPSIAPHKAPVPPPAPVPAQSRPRSAGPVPRRPATRQAAPAAGKPSSVASSGRRMSAGEVRSETVSASDAAASSSGAPGSPTATLRRHRALLARLQRKNFEEIEQLAALHDSTVKTRLSDYRRLEANAVRAATMRARAAKHERKMIAVRTQRILEEMARHTLSLRLSRSSKQAAACASALHAYSAQARAAAAEQMQAAAADRALQLESAQRALAAAAHSLAVVTEVAREETAKQVAQRQAAARSQRDALRRALRDMGTNEAALVEAIKAEQTHAEEAFLAAHVEPLDPCMARGGAPVDAASLIDARIRDTTDTDTDVGRAGTLARMSQRLGAFHAAASRNAAGVAQVIAAAAKDTAEAAEEAEVAVRAAAPTSMSNTGIAVGAA